jgi:4a-hydroxytetrahydrobiopterin dehydratase
MTALCPLTAAAPSRWSVRSRQRQTALTVVASQGLRDGEFGARDPFAAEVESNFSEKVLGNYDTSHVIRGPDGLKQYFGLAAKKCVPCEAGKAKALEEYDINRLRNQVPGWRLSEDAQGNKCLRQEWKVRNFTAGLELFSRIATVAEEEGHHPDLHLEGFNTVYAELSTHAVGGLTENDFVMAAKINSLDFTDLYPQKPRRLYFV